jgi:CHAD domain-containing protein
MSYRFRLSERIGDGVRRIGLEQIEIAKAKLTSREDAATAIHDTRRCLKRLRALLRLIQPGLDEGAFRREAGRLSGIGKLLAGARDLDVMRQTLTKLDGKFGEMPSGTAQRLDEVLARKARLNHKTRANGRREALQRLAQSQRFFAGKAMGAVELDHALEGLGYAYRKARKAFRHAYADPSDEAFHALRKRVQLHWRHMALLSRGWPEALSARASEAKELSRLLGEDHDYSILLELAKQPDAGALEAGDLAALRAVCTACQTELRAAAKPRGERLLAEPADNLEARVASYWNSAQCLAALAPTEDRAAAKRAPPSSTKVKALRRRAR